MTKLNTPPNPPTLTTASGAKAASHTELMVKLKSDFKLYHPWIFARSIVKPAERIPPGSIVTIVDYKGRFVGRGFYNGHSRIGLRVLTTDPKQQVDKAYFSSLLDQAISWRKQAGVFALTNGLRLVHSEGDHLSGLIVDLFADLLVVQYTSAGMFRLRDLIKELLLQSLPGSRFYHFAEARIQKQESFDCWELAAPEPVVITEQGVKFQVAVGSKHKTGFFADQRENRQLLAQFCEGQDVADLCCHSGGFGLYAKKLGGARSVVGVDLDEAEALAIARSNAVLNAVDVEYIAADVYDWLKATHSQHKRYGVVILDPAKQTRSIEQVGKALNDYYQMNLLAMKVVKPGGVLLTCSCSGLITEDQFLDVIKQAARDAGCEAQVFRISGAASDHPFLAQVTEGRYLKAVWCRITVKQLAS